MYSEIILDGEIHGTGVRTFEESYFPLSDLNISDNLARRINEWQHLYDLEHQRGLKNTTLIDYLDNIGIQLAFELQKFLPETTIRYFSNGKCIYMDIPTP